MRISSTGTNTGSVTVTPTTTQEYTLYAANSAGEVNSSTITVTVTGSAVTAPVITPPAGNYASNAPLMVSLSTPSAAPTSAGVMNATYYYTTNTGTGSSGAVLPPPPTTASTQYTGLGNSGSAITIFFESRRVGDNQRHCRGAWLFNAQRGNIGDLLLR